MKKLFSLLLLLVAVMTAGAQDDNRPITLPGKGKINVETLLKRIDTNMDISQLSVTELRVLRNAFAARQGYLFTNSDLRYVFNTTSWYDSLAWEREGNAEKMGPVKYTPQETAFINKLKAREDQLRKQNFKPSGMPNLDNVINTYQLNPFPEAMRTHLAKYGFGIAEADHEQIFQVYENNDYHMFPSFITTDLYLQLFHLYFDTVLRKVEESKLADVMASLCLKMHDAMENKAKTAKDKAMKDAAEWNTTFFAVGYQLLTEKKLSVPATYAAMAVDEYQASHEAKDGMSDFLGYPDVTFPYGLFRPRGHYTRSEKCQRYFRGMMWLQSMPFGTDKPHQMHRAALIAEVLRSDAAAKKAYDSVFDPITYLMGTADNITIIQVGDIMQRQNVTTERLIKDKKALKTFTDAVNQQASKQIRIRPKFELSSHNKVNFMPQRYQPDAEVLQEMCDYDSESTKRDVPMGLDVMAAMGSSAAERILIDELKQAQKWDQYTPNLNRMKKLMTTIEWKACVANKWLNTLNALNTNSDNRVQGFMKTPQWAKKNLNATLASWAELKHDAILYAKQPMAAECGDGSLPAPIVKGYVEPNVAFWTKALSLLEDTRGVLKQFGLLTDEVNSLTNDIHDEAQFLLDASKKELEGKRLTDEEYDHIRYMGATFENLSLEMIKEPDQYLAGWYDVQGADKSIAVVADVYTANGFNNPDWSILFEGVGPAHEIYVVVEVEGYLYLMRGGVFSYREFKQAFDQPRLTDEEWQEMLKQKPDTGKPSWMKEIMIPFKGEKPVDNETVFYGTGC